MTGHPLRLEQIDPCRWRLPSHGGMRVDGIVYGNAALVGDLRNDPCLEQVRNVAHLPGIVGASLAMPDVHWGYGFPIGGVAATSADEGVISPGGAVLERGAAWAVARGYGTQAELECV